MANWDGEAADAAAQEAAQELMSLGLEATVPQLADWWRRWYLKTPEGKQGAGHKRLARILMAIK